MADLTKIELEDCPDCRGMGALNHEGGWCTYVECVDCGAHTIFEEYGDESEKQNAEARVISLWNQGKVIHMNPGE